MVMWVTIGFIQTRTQEKDFIAMNEVLERKWLDMSYARNCPYFTRPIPVKLLKKKKKKKKEEEEKENKQITAETELHYFSHPQQRPFSHAKRNDDPLQQFNECTIFKSLPCFLATVPKLSFCVGLQ